MIEVEKKFILTKDQENALIKDAEFLGEKKIIDAYFDDSNYSLTKKDIWFRERNGRFELKIPMNDKIEERVSDQYRELEKDEEILKYFNVDPGVSIKDLLIENTYNAFCTLETTRKKYKKEVFNIDIDSIDYGYAIVEIEYMIEDESKIKEATEKIIKFAKSFGISTSEYVRGKVSEYLRRNSPDHFEALVDNGVVK